MRFEYTGKTKKVGTHTVKQIKALDGNSVFGVKPGDIGGWIEKDSNLKTDAPCWIGGDAVVMGDSEILDAVHICGNAIIIDSIIKSGGVDISGNARIIHSILSIRGSIEGNAIMDNVMATGYYFVIKDEAKITNSTIECSRFICQESASINQLTLETDKVTRTTFFEGIEFRDHCVLTGDIIMEGDNISIHDYVSLEGYIHIKNDSFYDLSLRDYVSVKSQFKQNPYLIVDSLSGDTMIQV